MSEGEKPRIQSLTISWDDMAWAVGEGLIEAKQGNTLWHALAGRHPERPGFDLANLAYYFGAMVVIGAMTFFMTVGWESFGHGGILTLSLVYAYLFLRVGRHLWADRGMKVPGGLLVTMAVCMAPLAIFAVESLLGWWPAGAPGSYRSYYTWINGSWIGIELGTMAVAAAALYFFRFPFLTMPIAFSIWFLSMDLPALLSGSQYLSWDERRVVSLCVGLVTLLVAWLVDRRSEVDLAFWPYLFGMVVFWGALTASHSGDELGKLLYALLNLGFMLLAVLLDRRVFVVFGALGVWGYLGHLSWSVFGDSLLFPFALTVLGLSIMGFGVLWQRYRDALEAGLRGLVPESWHRAFPGLRAI